MWFTYHDQCESYTLLMLQYIILYHYLHSCVSNFNMQWTATNISKESRLIDFLKVSPASLDIRRCICFHQVSNIASLTIVTLIVNHKQTISVLNNYSRGNPHTSSRFHNFSHDFSRDVFRFVLTHYYEMGYLSAELSEQGC